MSTSSNPELPDHDKEETMESGVTEPVEEAQESAEDSAQPDEGETGEAQAEGEAPDDFVFGTDAAGGFHVETLEYAKIGRSKKEDEDDEGRRRSFKGCSDRAPSTPVPAARCSGTNRGPK